MRTPCTLLAAATVLSLTVPVSAGLTAGAAPASAATTACAMTLDPDRRAAYRFKSGTRTLSYGQVVVQATRADPHRYCVRFQTGGRVVTHSFSLATYPRANGACGTRQLGALGSGTYRTGSYNQDMRVSDKQCQYRSYAIRADSTWWTVRIMRYNA